MKGKTKTCRLYLKIFYNKANGFLKFKGSYETNVKTDNWNCMKIRISTHENKPYQAEIQTMN